MKCELGYPSLDCHFQHDVCPIFNPLGCCTNTLEWTASFNSLLSTTVFTLFYTVFFALTEQLEPNLIGAADLFERFGTNPVKRKRVPRTDSDSIAL